MLDNGFKYKEQITELYNNTWYDDKYKFYHGSFYSEISIGDNDEYRRWFVSKTKHKIVGVITYGIDIHSNSVCDMGAINFSDDMFVFSKDLAQVIDDIFIKFNHNRLGFFVICGNPIEKSYDELILSLGGRIVGERYETTYINGYIYNDKEYELLRKDYLNHRYVIVGEKKYNEEKEKVK